MPIKELQFVRRSYSGCKGWLWLQRRAAPAQALLLVQPQSSACPQGWVSQDRTRGQERVKEAPGQPNYPQEQGYKRLQVGAGLGELLSPAWRMRTDGDVGLEGRDCCLRGGLEVSLGGRQ